MDLICTELIAVPHQSKKKRDREQSPPRAEAVQENVSDISKEIQELEHSIERNSSQK